jgi:DNA-binding MarR family transcriptional regulator
VEELAGADEAAGTAEAGETGETAGAAGPAGAGPDGAADDAARQIWSAVAELFFSAENQERFVGTADQLGLSPPMLKALAELEPGEGRPMRSLAEDWGCDASFVTVIVDGLEQHGYAERRVAAHDRRVRTVELTGEGVAAREWALGQVYGPRQGFWALTPDERVTLARLIRKLADAQAAFDAQFLSSGRARAFKHLGHAGHRGLRARLQHAMGPAQAAADDGAGGDAGESWRDHFSAQREELRRLRDELSRVRDEVRAQARRTAEDARPTGDDVAAAVGVPGGEDLAADLVGQVVDEVAAVADRAQAVEAEVKAQVRGQPRPPG